MLQKLKKNKLYANQTKNEFASSKMDFLGHVLPREGVMSQPHFEASVRMRLTLPTMETWSPPGLPKLHSSIARVKTPRLEVFFIPLERSWSVDVDNGFAWAIWTFAAQVMVERRAESQTFLDGLLKWKQSWVYVLKGKLHTKVAQEMHECPWRWENNKGVVGENFLLA